MQTNDLKLKMSLLSFQSNFEFGQSQLCCPTILPAGEGGIRKLRIFSRCSRTLSREVVISSSQKDLCAQKKLHSSLYTVDSAMQKATRGESTLRIDLSTGPIRTVISKRSAQVAEKAFPQQPNPPG